MWTFPEAKVYIFLNIQNCLIFGVLINAECYDWTMRIKPALRVWNLWCTCTKIASKCVSFTTAICHRKTSILKIWSGSHSKRGEQNMCLKNCINLIVAPLDLFGIQKMSWKWCSFNLIKLLYCKFLSLHVQFQPSLKKLSPYIGPVVWNFLGPWWLCALKKFDTFALLENFWIRQIKTYNIGFETWFPEIGFSIQHYQAFISIWYQMSILNAMLIKRKLECWYKNRLGNLSCKHLECNKAKSLFVIRGWGFVH